MLFMQILTDLVEFYR